MLEPQFNELPVIGEKIVDPGYANESLQTQRDLAFALVLEAYTEGQRNPQRPFRASHSAWKLRVYKDNA